MISSEPLAAPERRPLVVFNRNASILATRHDGWHLSRLKSLKLIWPSGKPNAIRPRSQFDSPSFSKNEAGPGKSARIKS
jgi:hypothetical protein